MNPHTYRYTSAGGPQKVLCLTTSFPSDPQDSTGFFILQLVENLAELDFNLTVLTPQSARPSCQISEKYKIQRFSYAPRQWQALAQNPGGIPVALKKSRMNYFLVPSFLSAFAWRVLVEARKSDVILANWAICGVLAALTSSWHRKPIITILRGSDVDPEKTRSSLSGRVLKKAINGSEAVVCVGQELAQQMQCLSDRPEIIQHIPNGIHPSFFSLPSPRPGKTVKLLFAGFLIPRKGVDIILRAIAELAERDLHLVIAGEGPLEVQLKAMTRDLGLESRVSFIGAVPPGNQMAEIMKECHCLVLPSYLEGRPNVVLEAMAGARPVIGSDIPGTRELVKESGAGYLFPKGDSSALAECLATLCKHKTDITQMGLRGRQHVVSCGLSWDQTANLYAALLRNCIRTSD